MQTRARESGEGIVLIMPNGIEIELAPWRGHRALKIWVKGADLAIKPQGTNAVELILEDAAPSPATDTSNGPSADKP